MWRRLPGLAAAVAVLAFAPLAFAKNDRPIAAPAPRVVRQGDRPFAPLVLPDKILRVVTPAQAKAAFDVMARQQDIAFGYPIDGCYSRAHLMVYRLLKMGYLPGKVWAFANGENLHARTLNDPRGYIEWGWHVAPTLLVQTAHGLQEMVIDPSLFSRPCSVVEWQRSMMKTPTSRQPFMFLTALGESPCRPGGSRTGGTGYWTGGDPAGCLDLHAHGVMRRYQNLADNR